MRESILDLVDESPFKPGFWIGEPARNFCGTTGDKKPLQRDTRGLLRSVHVLVLVCGPPPPPPPIQVPVRSETHRGNTSVQLSAGARHESQQHLLVLLFDIVERQLTVMNR